MYQEIDFYEFARAFELSRPQNFSRFGLVALYDWLTDLEEDTGEKMELDVIAICCDFAEYDSLEDMQQAYSYNYMTKEEFSDQTLLLPLENGGYVIQQF